MNVRLATYDDLPSLLLMFKGFVASAELGAKIPFDFKSAMQTLAPMLDQRWVLIAEHEGKPVGMLNWVVFPSMWNTSIVIAQGLVLWVEPHARKLGGARALVEAAIPLNKERGINVLLAFRPPQEGLARVYTDLGFEAIDHYYIKVF